MNESMSGEVFWVTGGASGIGSHLASCLYQRGANVVLSDIQLEALEVKTQSWDPKRFLVLKHDLKNLQDWQSGCEKVISKFSRIDCLMNVGGVVLPGFIHKLDPKEIDFHMDINAKGTMYGCQTVAVQMTNQGSGHLINFASLAGISPVRGMSCYVASKFAVRGFSLAIAQELIKENIHCTVVAPDLVDTPMLDLQLNYKEEAALVFSGTKPLTVSDIEKSIFNDVLPNKPIEVALPASRGFLAKLSNICPTLVLRLEPFFAKAGRKKQLKLESTRSK